MECYSSYSSTQFLSSYPIPNFTLKCMPFCHWNENKCKRICPYELVGGRYGNIMSPALLIACIWQENAFSLKRIDPPLQSQLLSLKARWTPASSQGRPPWWRDKQAAFTQPRLQPESLLPLILLLPAPPPPLISPLPSLPAHWYSSITLVEEVHFKDLCPLSLCLFSYYSHITQWKAIVTTQS